MSQTVLTIKKGCLSEEAEEKLQAMRILNINISAFIEWAIMNFDIEGYQKVLQRKQI